MAVAKAEMPAWTRRPGVLAAFDAIIYLQYGMMWLATAVHLAVVIGRRAFGDLQGSPVLSAASSVIRYSLTAGVLLVPAAAAGTLIYARRLLSVSKDYKKDIKDPLSPAVMGALVLMAFMALIAADDFGVGQSQVGSILRDLAPLGIGLAYHFIILPTTAQRQWKMKYGEITLNEAVKTCKANTRADSLLKFTDKY